jgi:actin-related protein 3
MVKEFSAYDKDPATKFKKYVGVNSRTKVPYTVDVGYEAFLGPELFFNPEVFPDAAARGARPLSQLVDEAISSAPMDNKRSLYRNIVLSGGSTLFKNFHRRLRDDINDRVQTRYDKMVAAHLARGRGVAGAVTATKAGSRVTAVAGADVASTGAESGRIVVDVVRHDMQRYAVWFGGSVFSTMPGFYEKCHTRAQYMEEGPRIARHNAVFHATM